MAESKSASPEALYQLQELLEHIANTANDADSLAYNSGAQQTELSDRLRDVICRIGWMADLALAKLGQPPLVGNAEEWLLPPSYARKPGEPVRVRHDSAREERSHA